MEKEKRRKLRISANWFILIDNLPYKRSFSMPYLRCLTPVDAEYVMREIHEGIYSNLLEAQALAYKLI